MGLTFLPWLRQGIGALPEVQKDPAFPDKIRRTVGVDFGLKIGLGGSNGSRQYQKAVLLKGPGEVTGINPLLVSRTEPLEGSVDFEPNYFPYVEFKDADLPWRYSLYKVSDKRVIPWIMLLVLKKDEFIIGDMNDGVQKIKVTKPVLPDLSQSWAWAHVQLADPNANGLDIKTRLSAFPHLCCSRIICPRKLESLTEYTGFLVPVYEMGRSAAFGVKPEGANLTGDFSWNTSSTDKDIPYYYSYSFRTTENTDFEELINRITFALVDPSLGQTLVDGSKPGYMVDDNKNEKIYFITDENGQQFKDMFYSEGALVPPGFDDNRSPVNGKEFSHDLTGKLNEIIKINYESQYEDDDIDPLVTLPVYGQYHKGVMPLKEPGMDGKWDLEDSWFDELNIDRRYRMIAATGAQLVRDNQERFMDLCWEQAGEIGKANELVFQAAACELYSDTIYKNHIANLDGFRFALMTQPFHQFYAHKGIYNEVSYKERFRECGLPEGMLSYPFRKILGQKIGLQYITEKMFFWVFFITGDVSFIETRHVDDDITWIRKMSMELFNDETPWTANGISEFKAEIIKVERVDVESLYRCFFNVREELVEWVREVIDIPWMEEENRSLDFILMSPRINWPAYRLLIEKSPDRLSAGIGSLEKNSILLMAENRKFIEALLAGMNYEMGKELVWNEFPTDRRATVFRYFWDPDEYTVENCDISDMHKWDKRLGDNHGGGKGLSNLVLVIKSDLMRRYPDMVMIPVKAGIDNTQNDWEQIFLQIGNGIERSEDLFEVQKPVFTGVISMDSILIGLPFDEEAARSGEYYFIFMQHATLARFGLDISREGDFNNWDDICQEDVFFDPSSNYLDFTKIKSDTCKNYNDGLVNSPNTVPVFNSDSGAMAWIAYQKPVRVIVPLTVLLDNK